MLTTFLLTLFDEAGEVDDDDDDDELLFWTTGGSTLLFVGFSVVFTKFLLVSSDARLLLLLLLVDVDVAVVLPLFDLLFGSATTVTCGASPFVVDSYLAAVFAT